MSDDELLRELLEKVVPVPPVAADRASSARAVALRRRHRRTAILGAAAVVLVAASVPAMLALSDSTRREPTTPGTPSPSPAVTDVPCPRLVDGEGEAGTPSVEPGTGTLPPGAVAARLCDLYSQGWQPPEDLLTTQVDELVRTVNELPVEAAGKDTPCTAEGGISYAIAFGYPDGSTSVVEGSLVGCRFVELAGVDALNYVRSRHEARRRGGELVWDRFLSLLREQRRTLTAPAPEISLACAVDPYNDLSPVGRPEELTRALLCWSRTDLQTDLPWSTAKLTSAELETLLHDLAANTSRRHATEEECRNATLRFEIIGQNVWGDRIAIFGDCGYFEIGDGRRWWPGPQAQAVLDRLLASAAPVQIPLPDERTRPDEVLAAYIDFLNAGDFDAAGSLWAGIPDFKRDLGHVDLKVGGVQPIRSFESSRFAVRVEALYRVSPDDGSWRDYRNVAFTLVRNSRSEPWRISSMTDLGAANTGR